MSVFHQVPLLTGLLMDCGWGEWGGGWRLVLSPRPFQDLQGCELEYLLMVPWASSIAHELWLRRVGAKNNPLSGSLGTWPGISPTRSSGFLVCWQTVAVMVLEPNTGHFRISRV